MDYRIHAVIRALEARVAPSNYQAITEEHLHALLDELAAEVNLSPSRLRALFKNATGQSFNCYVKHLRLEKAREMLGSTHLRITEIAARLGYEDVSHFIREFKRAFSMTPGACRLAITQGRK